MRIAVLTFDEPEFEPSYAGTSNQGKGAFSWLFFTGRCRLSDLSFAVLRHGALRGVAYLGCGLAYAMRSFFARSETIFEVLDKAGVRATFFGVFSLIDDPARRAVYLPVFRAILDRGHELGLHGYRHGPLTIEDLERSEALARSQLGAQLRTYSSPFGDDREGVATLLEQRGFLGMRVWDRALLKRPSRMQLFPYEYDLDKVASTNEAVIIVNLHSGDFYPWGGRRVKRTIAALHGRGYRFMTFAELCALAGPPDDGVDDQPRDPHA